MWLLLNTNKKSYIEWPWTKSLRFCYQGTLPKILVNQQSQPGHSGAHINRDLAGDQGQTWNLKPPSSLLRTAPVLSSSLYDMSPCSKLWRERNITILPLYFFDCISNNISLLSFIYLFIKIYWYWIGQLHCRILPWRPVKKNKILHISYNYRLINLSNITCGTVALILPSIATLWESLVSCNPILFVKHI